MSGQTKRYEELGDLTAANVVLRIQARDAELRRAVAEDEPFYWCLCVIVFAQMLSL